MVNSESIKDRGKSYDTCIKDAVKHFEVASPEEVSSCAWEGLFNTRACGFPDNGERILTVALVVTISPRKGNPHSGPVRVYVDSKFAYEVTYPNDAYVVDMTACKLMDAQNYNGEYEMKAWELVNDDDDDGDDW